MIMAVFKMFSVKMFKISWIEMSECNHILSDTKDHIWENHMCKKIIYRRSLILIDSRERSAGWVDIVVAFSVTKIRNLTILKTPGPDRAARTSPCCRTDSAWGWRWWTRHCSRRSYYRITNISLVENIFMMVFAWWWLPVENMYRRER